VADPTLKEQILQDLKPLPGRLGSTSRIVLATVISLILLLVWQMPFANIGLYFIFLLTRDSPALSFRSGVFSLFAVMSAVAVEIGVVALTDNSPVARVLSVSVVAFVAGMITLGSNLPQLGPAYGLIFCTLIAFWESSAPADALVKNSLWLLAAFSLAVGCSIAVEYIFVSPRLGEKLQEQRQVRYTALQKMFSAHARGAASPEIAEAMQAVQRLAAAGQGGMQALYNLIVERNLDTTPFPIGMRVRITMLAQLMDDAAAFGSQHWVDDSSMRVRCARIAEQCAELAQEKPAVERIETRLDHASSTMSLLDHVEQTLHVIRTMPAKEQQESDRSLISIPASKTPFWRPGALENPDTISFALKVSLCVTICYLAYHAVDWQGISTCVTTVFICAAGASGAFK
jgi:multidrug resistance protein MdtO